MAYYSYKRVRDLIPDDFQSEWEKKWKEEYGRDFDGSADYDGELWILAADYIEYLKKEVERLSCASENQG